MRVLILRRIVAVVAVAVICSGDGSSATASQAGHTDLPIVSATPAQPLREQVHSLVNVLQSLGSPVPQTVQQNLNLTTAKRQNRDPLEFLKTLLLRGPTAAQPLLYRNPLPDTS